MKIDNKVQEFCSAYDKSRRLAEKKLTITRGYYAMLGAIDTRTSEGIRYFKKAYGSDNILGYVDISWVEIFND